MRRILPLAVLALVACPAPQTTDDGGVVDDAGPPPPCDSPEDCKVLGFDGVCRQNVCTAAVPCASDLECGLGEDCIDAQCTFTGCITDADCPTGACRTATYSCAECGADADCPSERPTCQLTSQKCVQCSDDSQCPEPGPAHCEAISGICQDCLQDEHCPPGLYCRGGECSGASQGVACKVDVSCSAGLTCATVGTSSVCLKSCNAYAPDCLPGQVCYTLKYTDLDSYVFDEGGLLGVCYAPSMGARNYRDSCIRTDMGLSNCQPSLQCVPDSALTAECRSYCDPGMPGSCPAPELCHPFVGDFNGRLYGLCYADNGYGAKCASDGQCRSGEACVPFDDPSSFEGLSTVCQFNAGAGTGLSPCGNTTLADGGMVSGNTQCASGACEGDAFPTTAPYFCYAACVTDSDCTVGARSGTCDQEYDFTTSTGLDSFIIGCRPNCTSTASCAEYGSQYVCRPRLSQSFTNGGLKLNCGGATGSLPAGAACTSSSQCVSGYCFTADERGINRGGVCLESCTSPADCTADSDGGVPTVSPIACLPTMFIGYLGDDFVPGTADDEVSPSRVCLGVACAQDSDCSADGGSRCVPEVSPADAGALVLRCRPPTTLGISEAGQSCALDGDCRSGSCGTLSATSQRVCFEPCTMAGAACPGALTCQAGAFMLTSTQGIRLPFDGCAP